MIDRPVVQRGAAVEDRDQQLRAQVGVERHSGLGREVLEAGVALDDDEGPVPGTRKQPGRPAHLPGHALRQRDLARHEESVQRAKAANLLESAPQLGLEDDHDREQAHHRAGLQKRGEELEIEGLRGQVDEVQDRQTDDDPHRPRAADEDEEPVDDDRDQQDVDDRRPAAPEVRIEELADRVQHKRFSRPCYVRAILPKGPFYPGLPAWVFG